MVRKYKIITLGCRTNQYESQMYADQLKTYGFEKAGREAADICIVNSCSVTQNAEKSSLQEISKISKENPKAKIVMTGCAAEAAQEFLENNGIFFVSNLEKDHLIERVFPEFVDLDYSIKEFAGHTRAFVKVQDGCNSFCSYCIIPYVRGRSRSKEIADIVKEVQGLVENGYKEIVLTGINIGDYISARGENLSDLIKRCDQIPNLKRIRVSSIDPEQVDDHLIETILQGQKTCKSMHLVLQSGSNVILKRMNRKYTKQMYLDRVEKIQAACPDFTFTTDVIVGFPGETERDFQDTMEIIKRVQFAKVHMFPFSPRKKTKAYSYPNKIPKKVIDQRKKEILDLSEREAFSLREKYLGQKMTILTEQRDEKDKNIIPGHTDNFLKVIVENATLEPNELVQVQIVKNSKSGLIGKIYENSNF